MNNMYLFRERYRSGAPFDLNDLGDHFAWRDTSGHPMCWFVEPDPMSSEHFYVTYLGGNKGNV